MKIVIIEDGPKTGIYLGRKPNEPAWSRISMSTIGMVCAKRDPMPATRTLSW